MTTEQQCLAMARDQGDEPKRFMSFSKFRDITVKKYSTREAVVEAIRRKSEDDPSFKCEFQEHLHTILAEKYKTVIDIGFLMAICEVNELREAYLKASGLWVEESTGDKTSPTQKWKAQEEVVLPTKDNYVYWSYRDNSGEWQHVQSTPKAAADTLMKLSKELKIFEDHHKAIMEELAEARRGL